MKLFVIVIIFIVLDCLTGILNAVKNKEINSSKMRSGFFNKSAFILIVVLAILCDYTMKFIDVGFNAHLFQIASVYVIVTETTSIIENIGNLNNKVVPEYIKRMFLKIGDNEE